MTDDDWAAIDRLGVALEAAPRGLTPSAGARTARIVKDDGRADTHRARQLLAVMHAARLALTSGNGAWTRYHAYDRHHDATLDRRTTRSPR